MLIQFTIQGLPESAETGVRVHAEVAPPLSLAALAAAFPFDGAFHFRVQSALSDGTYARTPSGTSSQFDFALVTVVSRRRGAPSRVRFASLTRRMCSAPPSRASPHTSRMT